MAVPELRHVVHAYEAVSGYDVVHDHTVMGPFYAERYPDLPHGYFTADAKAALLAFRERAESASDNALLEEFPAEAGGAQFFEDQLGCGVRFGAAGHAASDGVGEGFEERDSAAAGEGGADDALGDVVVISTGISIAGSFGGRLGDGI